MKLYRKPDQEVLVQNLTVADNLFTRIKGLLGTKALSQGSAMWIHSCDSIHTFFMNYTIDCVFLDKNLSVVSVKPEIKPYRMVWPQRKAKSVVEMSAGSIHSKKIKIGDQLYVGH